MDALNRLTLHVLAPRFITGPASRLLGRPAPVSWRDGDRWPRSRRSGRSRHLWPIPLDVRRRSSRHPADPQRHSDDPRRTTEDVDDAQVPDVRGCLTLGRLRYRPTVRKATKVQYTQPWTSQGVAAK